jgi:hypothetical protein
VDTAPAGRGWRGESRMVRAALAMAAALFLAGCNTVVTPQPLFTLADQGAGPGARTGVWRFDTTDDCKIDEARPLGEWPACANGLVIQDGGMAGFYDRSGGASVWTVEPMLLVPGQPLVIQARITASGDMKLEGKPYGYFGGRVTKTDARGRIIGFNTWPVQCGPPPTEEGAMLTKKLLPGLTAKGDDAFCATTSVDALRNAARASEAWARTVTEAHWVRDGGP